MDDLIKLLEKQNISVNQPANQLIKEVEQIKDKKIRYKILLKIFTINLTKKINK